MRTLLPVLACIIWLLAFTFPGQSGFSRKEKLSEYNFFVGKLSDLKHADDLIPYAVNTPLFSNYAEKLRFVKFPTGQSAQYDDTSAFIFPEGTILIKNFYYPIDFRKPEKG